MTDTVKIAVDALRVKALELAEDRAAVRRRVLEDAFRLTQIERDLAGCIGGARALGQEIDVPAQFNIPKDKMPAFTQFHGWAMSIGGQYPALKSEFGIDDDVDSTDSDDARPEMPRIADIILERLQAAGQEGTKAADIRRYIFRTYKSDIHEKTVGMTLNRMQSNGQVRRDGRTWFLAQV